MDTTMVIVYVVFLAALFYFMIIRPQKKEKKRTQDMFNSMAIGDYVVTTSGFYGQLIDITNDMVIVEFGSKHCRIPMLKSAIARIEKDDALTKGASGSEGGDSDKVAKEAGKQIETGEKKD